jgi:hypothetical protein
MGSSLSDIPGAGGDKGRRKRGSGGDASASQPWRSPARRTVSERSAGRRSAPRFTPRIEVDRVNLALAASFAVLLLIGVAWLWRTNRVTLSIEGLEDGGSVTTEAAEALTLDFVVDPQDRLDSAEIELDGEDITDEVEATGTSLRWTPDPADPLEEGEHAFSVRVPRAVAGTAARTFRISVDDTEPVLEVDDVEPVSLEEPVTVTGTVDETVDLMAGDEEVSVDDDGSFAIDYDVAPAGAIDLVATDPAGNATALVVLVPVRYPGTHAIHLGADSWANDAIRAAVLDQMGGSFDAVVLDVKDECGLLGGQVDLDLAGQIGANTDRYELDDAVAAIEESGGRAIARVVAFRDPALTAWAWSNRHPEWVLQDTSSSPWPDFTAPDDCADPGVAPALGGGAANFTEPEVQEYVLSIVRATAAAGFGDVMLDDVRRPSGDPANLKLTLADPVEGEDEEAEAVSADPVAEALTEFLQRARDVARSEGAYLGVTASGLSVREPSVYSQDLARFATAVDYIAPEVYPESYSTGFFNLESPINAPGQAVAGALQEAREQVGDAPIELVPWIQDYSGAVPYGAAEVQAQVDGAAEVGSCSFIREDPSRNYTAGIQASC